MRSTQSVVRDRLPAIRADRRTAGPESCESLPYVPAGDERGFLAPHPLEVLPELDSNLRLRLEEYQLELIGEVAAISESALCAVFGRSGGILRARARGKLADDPAALP